MMNPTQNLQPVEQEQRSLQLVTQPTQLTAKDITAQITLIQEVMRDAMKDGTHYGKIPGCGDKPTLLKAGSEKLCMLFRLAPKFNIIQNDLPNGHREYKIITTLNHITTGNFVGEGVGSCSTLEPKYRYRNASDYEITDQSIPKDAKEKKAEYRKQGYGMKQVGGQWVWVRYKSESKVENPDIAETYNTVLKMAKKRSMVDAVLTVTAASDIFAQDLEDLMLKERENNVSDDVKTPSMKEEANDYYNKQSTPRAKVANVTDNLRAVGITEQQRNCLTKLGYSEEQITQVHTFHEAADLIKKGAAK